jgi:hypothetical protein
MPTNLEQNARLAWLRICREYNQMRERTAGMPLEQQLWDEEWGNHPIPAAVVESHFQFKIVESTAIIGGRFGGDRILSKELPAYVFETVGNPPRGLDPVEKARQFGVAPLGRIFNVERACTKYKQPPPYPDGIRKEDVIPLEEETKAAAEVHKAAVMGLIDAVKAAMPLFEVFRDPVSQPAFQQGLNEIAKRYGKLIFESIPVITAEDKLVMLRYAVYPGMVEHENLISRSRDAYAPRLVKPLDRDTSYSHGWQMVSAEMSAFCDKIDQRKLVLVAVESALASVDATKNKVPVDIMQTVFPKQLIDAAAYGYSLLSKVDQERTTSDMEKLMEARQRADELDLAVLNGNDSARQERFDNRALLSELSKRLMRRDEGIRTRLSGLAPVIKSLDAAVARVDEALELHNEAKAKLERAAGVFKAALAVYEKGVEETDEYNQKLDHDIQVSLQTYSKLI